MARTKLYICTGASWINGYGVGYCGDVHTLNEWLEILFPGKNAADYFKGAPSKEVCDYIYRMCGKRLEVYKNDN